MTTTRATADESPRITGTEWALLAVVILAGFAARAWSLATVGLNQYDEGVYALSAQAISSGDNALRLFPGQSKYFAPPVYYILVGLLNKVSGTTSFIAPIGLNIALGTLSVGLIWRVARTWFGPVAGIMAATILALNEFHITFSRSGLTDVAFAFFFLLALHLIVAALQRGSLWLSVLAGLVVGAAWNTKYHGWFALFVGSAALLPLILRQGWQVLLERRAWLPLTVIWVVAIACYLPWLTLIQSQPGGYEAFARYQSRFVSLRWITNLFRQVEMQSYFEGPMSRASVLAAFLMGSLMNAAGQTWKRFLLCTAGLSLSGLLVGSSGTLLLATLAAVPWLLQRGTPAAWTQLGWVALWLVVTPFYRPYARLVIPVTMAMSLGAAVAIAGVLSGVSQQRTRLDWLQLAVGVIALASVVAIASRLDGMHRWRPANGAVEVANRISTSVPRGGEIVVLGEPALGFYLHARGYPLSGPLENLAALSDVRSPTYVVTGVYPKRADDLRRHLEAFGARLVPLATYPFIPSDVRLIDDMRVPEARGYVARPDATFDITLYRLDPEDKQ